MKKILGLLLTLCALGFAPAPALAQSQVPFPVGPTSQARFHNVAGVYVAPQYATWAAIVISGNTTTGSGVSIIVTAPGPLADQTLIPAATLLNTNVPITVADNNAETMTPTSVSIAPCPAGNIGVGGSQNCATITGTFNNTHGPSAVVVSGDNGIEEAVTDAGNNGGGNVFWMVDTGNVTLSTTGLTTTSTTFVPSEFYNLGASARVETTITTSTNWAVGIASHTSAFCSVNTGLTAGTTCAATQVAPTFVGTTTALTAVLITVTGANAGAGVVKSRVWGYTPVQAAQ